MVYVNQSRVIPAKPLAYRFYRVDNKAGTLQEGETSMGDSAQSTFSWRTGGKYKSAEEQYESLSTQGLKELARKEGADYRRDPTMWDNGHDFNTRRDDWETYQPYVSALGSPNGGTSTAWRYQGPVLASIKSLPNQGLPEWSMPDIDDDGARAISAAAPTAPQAGLGQFLGELREGLPALIGARTVIQAKKRGSPHAGDLSDEWVNHNFATMPLAGDIVKTTRALLGASHALRQLVYDSGKNVRRRRVLYETSEYVQRPSVSLTLQIPPMIAKGSVTASFLTPRTATYTVTDHIVVKCTFASAFTYFMTLAESHLDQMNEYEQRARLLLGASITPSTVWELTPWSWLIDWNYNIGGLLKTAELFASDGLVMRFGYIMHEIHATRSYTAPADVTAVRDGTRLGVPTFTASTSWKNRKRATPYGFGLDAGAFSPKQWSILGALGMSKGHQALRVD